MPTFFTKDHHQEHKEQHHSLSEEEKDLDPVRTLLEWVAPARPFKKKDRSYYTTIAILVVLLILISLLAQEILLIGVILALAFVAYVLGFVPPEDVQYKVSTQGIMAGDHFYFWGDLHGFWFSQKEGASVLHVLTHFRFPAQLMIVLGNVKEDEIKNVMAKYILYYEIAPKNLLDNWAEGLQKHFPLETPHK